MQNTYSKLFRPTLVLLASVGTFLVSAPMSLAKNGKDDPAGHNAGDNRGGKPGADDPAGHDVPTPRPSTDDSADKADDDLRRIRGSDDPAGHDLADDRGGKGGGTDDPANHNAGDDKGGVNKSGGKGRGGKDDAPGHR